MKIVFATDIHLRYTPVQTRIDKENFLNNVINKIKFVIDYANENSDILIFGGDIFERPDIHHSLIVMFLKEIKRYKNMIYTLIGNHDIYGLEDKTLNKTALGILLETEIIQILNEIETENVYIKGMHCFSEEVFNDGKQNKLNILFTHKPIIDLDFIPNSINPTKISQITNYDIIISGHIHKQYEYNINGRIFLNPGPLVRNSVTEKDIDIKILFIDTEKKEYKFIDVPHVKNVFDENIISFNMQYGAEFIDSYVKNIFETKTNNKPILNLLVEHIDNLNINQELKNFIKMYIYNFEQTRRG